MLAILDRERFTLRSMTLSDYLWDFLQRTGLYLYESSRPGGDRRRADLQYLCQRAWDYEETWCDGPEGFVNAML